MLLTLIRRRWTVLVTILAVGGAVVACGDNGAGPGAGQVGDTGNANTIEVNTVGIEFADRLVDNNGRSH